MDRVLCEYYLRFMAADKPGVLGRIASVLGEHKISMASVIQQERAPQVTVPVVMRTHECEERNLKLALAEIRRRKIVKAEPVFIRIEERFRETPMADANQREYPRLSRWPGLIEHYRRFLSGDPGHARGHAQ